jgi:1-acyl-sn-glycerol-3-phosphate acyltransferase
MQSYQDPPPALFSRIARAVLLWFYRTRGWKATGTPPADRRCVIIAAPHTSNWDFVNLLGLTSDLGVKVHFMGKTSLFRWPLRRFMADMGGIPVDRHTRHNAVQAMVDEFARRKEFMLVIAPEGTRSAVTQWRTGFYHIAQAAGVPLVIGMMDYGKKSGGLGPAIMPSGDYRADMAKIVEFYCGVTPRNPHWAIKDFSVVTGNIPAR